MKKSSKPGIIILLLLSITAALTVLAYVAIKKKCELFTKEKVLAEEELSSALNRRVSLTAQYQMFASEERITNIALTELGMKKRTEPAVQMYPDKDKIERISRLLKEKYE